MTDVPADDSSKAKPESDPLKVIAPLLLAKAQSGELIFDSNVAGPRIKLPNNGANQFWPLAHSRVHAWLTKFAYDATGCVLSEIDRKRLIPLLEAEAWTRSHHTDEAEYRQLLYDEPVLAALIAFMADKSEYHHLAAQLLKDLNQFATDNRLHVSRKGHWPLAANFLTKKLRHHQTVLEELGLHVSLRRDKSGCQVTIKSLTRESDDAIVTPSSGSSPPNSATALYIEHRDDGDDDPESLANGIKAEFTDLIESNSSE